MIEKHIPGRLQISTECNQDCLFCSVPKFPVEKPSLEELKKRVKELKEAGTTDLFITGGEPTIHKDLFQILDFAEETGFKEITIQSNGANLTASFLNKIKSYGNVKFDISFHSYEEDVFNKLSGSTNYKSFLLGLENILDLDIPIFLTIVINSLNYKKLKEHIIFIRRNFPNITHFSFNFVDPVNRAQENKWVVPTLRETQRYIYETIRYILDNGLTFRLERVPLCYMQGFEEYSTEVRLHALDEKRLTFFAQKSESDNNSMYVEKKSCYLHTEACNYCLLKDICPGLNRSYAAIHGSEELFPVFIKPETIIAKVRQSRMVTLPKKKIIFPFKIQVHRDLELFKQAIQIKPNKNNVYDTYSHFLMQIAGFQDESFIYDSWKEFVGKVREGVEPNLLSFYIHFPYCQSSCDYCVYPSTPFQNRQQIEDYINYLIREMKQFSPLFKELKFKTLSIGGGTPSLMSETQLETLFTNIYKYFEFEENGEKSIEFNPNTTTSEKLKVVDKFGFNKLSIGVQSLSPEVLKKNNRGYQTENKIRQVVNDFKKTGIGYLNIDLVLGLKGDTPKDFLYSFEEICKMGPNLIAIYPIKTNDSYVKSQYGDLKEFLNFYYPLFDRVTKGIPAIAEKYRYTCQEDLSKLSYVHPIAFWRRDQPDRNVNYQYSNFKVEPYSNFGLGYYSESCINNMMRYTHVDTRNPSTLFLKKFSTNEKDFMYHKSIFLPTYSKVKFITHSAYERFAISREEYKKMFGKDIADDFPYAIKALEHLKIITVTNEKISFNVKDEKELYEPLLFFVGREIVIENIRKMRQSGK